MRLLFAVAFVAGLSNASAIYYAPAGNTGSASGFLSASAFVSYSGRPAPAVSDVAQLSLPIRVTVVDSTLTGTGPAAFQACFNFDTMDFTDWSVSSYASASFGGYNPASNGNCTGAIPYTIGETQIFNVDLYAKVTADWLVRYPSTAFDVSASVTLTQLRGVDVRTGTPYGITVLWDPLVVRAAAVPEPAPFFLLAIALAALFYFHRPAVLQPAAIAKRTRE